MRYQRPGSVIFGKCFAIAFIILVPLGYCLLQNAADLHSKLEREQAERRRPPMENSDCRFFSGGGRCAYISMPLPRRK